MLLMTLLMEWRTTFEAPREDVLSDLLATLDADWISPLHAPQPSTSYRPSRASHGHGTTVPKCPIL